MLSWYAMVAIHSWAAWIQKSCSNICHHDVNKPCGLNAVSVAYCKTMVFPGHVVSYDWKYLVRRQAKKEYQSC